MFFTKLLHTGTTPLSLKRAQIIAILNLGKSNIRLENSCPIALLSLVGKLIERTELSKIFFKMSPLSK